LSRQLCGGFGADWEDAEGYGNPAHLRIKMGLDLQEVDSERVRAPYCLPSLDVRYTELPDEGVQEDHTDKVIDYVGADWHFEAGLCNSFANRKQQKRANLSVDPSRPPAGADFVW
jgi:hypothetical protein